MSQGNSPGFSGLRSYFWPVHMHELTKIIPMIIMLSFIALDSTILRNLKDSLVVTARGSGAEIIPFIKVWGILPAAIAAAMLFSFLLNRFSRSTVIHIIILSFTAFFLLFTCFVYPHREFLHPHASADFLETVLPVGCKGLIAMYRNWTLTCFYIISELWSTIVLQVLVWGFANEITKIAEAPRFYSVMVIASNFATICAGQIAVALSSNRFDSSLGFGSNAWEQTMTKILLLVAILAIGALFAFRWMDKHVLSRQDFSADSEKNPKKEPSKKLSFRESLSCLARSRHLLGIATIVISYNLVINLVEVIWKDRLRLMYPSPSDYNIYISNLASAVGVISMIVSVLMAGIIDRLGWTKIALMTPCVLFVTSAAFFICLFGGESISPFLTTFLGTTPLALAVLFGSAQNCFSKAAKYSVFDATKEMAFIPLGREEKIQGKSAIDGIGSRVAKAGSSVIHQGFLLFFGTLTNSAPYVAVIVAVVIVVWVFATRILGRELRPYMEEKEALAQV